MSKTNKPDPALAAVQAIIRLRAKCDIEVAAAQARCAERISATFNGLTESDRKRAEDALAALGRKSMN